jgi:hypothetical protein
VRIGRREVAITNPDKVFFPEPGLTKGDLIAYYLDVAGCVLNHVRRRPMHMSCLELLGCDSSDRGCVKRPRPFPRVRLEWAEIRSVR